MDNTFSPDILSSIASDSGVARPNSVLLIGREPAILSFLHSVLDQQCSLVEAAGNMRAAEQLLARCDFDLVVVDARSPRGAADEWVRSLRQMDQALPLIVLSGDTSLPPVSRCEFLLDPVSTDRLHAAVERALMRRQPLCWCDVLQDSRLAQACGVPGIIGESEAARSMLKTIQRVAPHDTTVLLQGESGTGKEVAARSLHYFSGRPGPFVAVNCGSISPELLESELFGHAKGAFTGATQAHEGLFSTADGGTLFLDEIGEMPLPMQAKLLRVLEQGAIRPVGVTREVPVNVRIVTATNRTLADEVARGSFREDLYYRLNVVSLRLPALRERPADIVPLARLFIDVMAKRMSLPPPELNEHELQRLQAYHWPGNVRELKNTIERALLMDMSPADCLDGLPAGGAPDAMEAMENTGYSISLTLEDVERHHILKVLSAVNGNKSEAARRLGISRKTLERKVTAWQAAPA